MEALLVLVGIIFLALPVVVIVLIVRQARLFRELAELRQRVDTLTAGRTPWRDQPDQTLAAPSPRVQDPRFWADLEALPRAREGREEGTFSKILSKFC